jgi:hypothetical protein
VGFGSPIWRDLPGSIAPAVNVYHNELFTDGDVLGGGGEQGGQHGHLGAAGPSGAAPPGSSSKMQQQKSTFAARRQERMQANLYEANATAGRGMGSPMAGGRGGGYAANGGQRGAPAASPSDQGAYAADGNRTAVYGLASTYDPNEEEGAAQGQVQARSHPGQAGHYQQMPQQLRLDLSDLPSFLHTPGPKTQPVLCYIVRDKGSAKMYPKVRQGCMRAPVFVGPRKGAGRLWAGGGVVGEGFTSHHTHACCLRGARLWGGGKGTLVTSHHITSHINASRHRKNWATLYSLMWPRPSARAAVLVGHHVQHY